MLQSVPLSDAGLWPPLLWNRPWACPKRLRRRPRAPLAPPAGQAPPPRSAITAQPPSPCGPVTRRPGRDRGAAALRQQLGLAVALETADRRAATVVERDRPELDLAQAQARRVEEDGLHLAGVGLRTEAADVRAQIDHIAARVDHAPGAGHVHVLRRRGPVRVQA